METTAFSALFCEIFAKNGLERFCAPEIIEKFCNFTDILLTENAKYNLTAIREPAEVIAKHYADCLLAEALFPQNATVLDLGCGGGFPTFPLAIVRPDLRITALDSTQKKITFVKNTAKMLDLPHITALCARAEEVAGGIYRSGFDIVTSRAMARMNILTELGLPCLRIGGKMIVLKGAQGTEELKEAQNAIRTLGGTAREALPLSLVAPQGVESRHILVVEKKKDSPAQYPRQYAVILKKPL